MPSALLQRLIAQRQEVADRIATMDTEVEQRIAAAEDDTERHVTEDERAELRQLDERAEELDGEIARIEAREAREAAAAEVALRVVPDAGVEQRAGGARVTSEPTVYGPNSRASWVLDQFLIQQRTQSFDGFGGLNLATTAEDAMQRLDRYRQELVVEQRSAPVWSSMVEVRDATTTSYAGLVPPQYLLNEYAALLRAGRPTANVAQGMGMPDTGMSLIIPRATAGTTVSTQATQNTAPTTTDMTVTDLTVPINSFQGRAVLSRQAMQRGGVDLDRLTFADLAADAARYLDQQVLFGSGAGGNATGIVITAGIIAIAQTATTGLDSLKAIANAIQSINTQRFLPPDVIIMHPRRWGFLTIAVDTANRPLVTVEAGSLNIFGQGEAAATQQVVGSIQGIPVITDPNVRVNQGAGTNQDEIIVGRRGDWYLWENAIQQFTFEQPAGPASVQLALYGNHAFTAARYPTGTALISGAGLVPPTF